MLTEEEQGFVRYWEENRIRKKKVFRQLSAGLPLAAFVVLALFINIFSGWYWSALSTLRLDAGEGLMILISAVLIVLFIVIFSAYHRWDMNEQHYRELLSRKEGPKNISNDHL